MSIRQTVRAPEWVRRWPRGWRVTLFTTALVITTVVVIPALIMGAGYLVGFGTCDRPDAAAASSVCSPPGRLLFTAALIAVGLPLALSWARFLVRALALKDDQAQRPINSAGHAPPRIPANASTELWGWQQLVSGKIELCDRTAHTISFKGSPLTFWSVHAFQKGWLKQGDRTVIVYQRTPLRSLNLALAYWDGQLSSVRGVAAGAQTASVLIAVTCILIFAWLRPPFAGFWMAFCGVLTIVNSLYLVLMMRAKAVLRAFVDSEAAL
jgi:hypothetical protein